MNDRPRRLLAIVIPAVLVALGAWALFTRVGFIDLSPRSGGDSVAVHLPRLDGPIVWLNRGSLTLDSLAGHPVVLVFWSDTDPRSLDDLPHVQSWWQAYARYGVRVLGIHGADYAFAADSSVAARVAQRLELTFPIALDRDFALRVRFGGETPRRGFVVADPAGRIVVRSPAGHRARVDRAIRDLLRQAHPELGFPTEPAYAEADVETAPEPRVIPLGTARVRQGPLVGARPGQAFTFTTQFRFQEEGVPYVPYPVGRWIPDAEALTAARGGAATFVAVRSGGERVGAVIAPAPSGRSKVWVLSDDTWMSPDRLAEDARLDPRGESYVEVSEPRLYWIQRPGKARVLRLSPEEAGVKLYAFVFVPAKGTAELSGAGPGIPPAQP